jgi:carbon storage regulator
MLVLSRQTDESIIIGENIVLTVLSIRGDRVRLGITAPTEIPVHRKEIYDSLKLEVKGGDVPSLPGKKGT